MADFEVPPNGTALSLVQSEYLQDVLDKMERDAVEKMLRAPSSDNETRLTGSLEVKAIRSLRSALLSLSKGKDKPKERNPVI